MTDGVWDTIIEDDLDTLESRFKDKDMTIDQRENFVNLFVHLRII